MHALNTLYMYINNINQLDKTMLIHTCTSSGYISVVVLFSYQEFKLGGMAVPKVHD